MWASGWPGGQLLRYWCGPVEQGKGNVIFDCVKSAVLPGSGPRGELMPLWRIDPATVWSICVVSGVAACHL